ncbi:MAG: ABC transporter ATP-binding protein [Lachnospiraceae bacterium]|uniref:ABC transporter ATP-binding protein n=1 Tax=uncultured Acetatifactor sp. TaxID=1671927 RepID=UPI00261777A0|nr:ABC transporter ATP-binding protein [uncultured Acetatifactor sp.]MCI8790564.1 ABC transporter ATP-binding protein [Lachnospiraceae bacterium]
MNRLMKYLSGYKKESILAPLFKLLEAFFELLVPLVMASIIDRGIHVGGAGGPDTAHIWRMGLCLLALAVVGLVSSITAQFFAAKAAVGFSAKLRQALFDHIQGLDFTNVDKAGTSTMITRMTSDVNQIQSGVNLVLRLFLRSPIIVFGAMIMAFTIDVKSALVFVVAIPLLAIVVFGIMIWTMPLYKKVQANLDRVLGVTRENLTGVRVIRAFHQEEKEEERFRGHTNALADSQVFVGKISAVMNPVTYVVVNGAIIVLIYIGAVQVNVGSLTQGEVVAIINYMSQILVELVKLANLIITVTKALACADRVAGVFEIQNEDWMTAGRQVSDGKAQTVQPGSGTGETPFLQFDHVSLTYAGAGAETLHDIDFTVNKGDTIGVIGGTGSGKSSLINLIPGFYPATEGCIRLEGKDIRQMPEGELRQIVGMVPQKAVLFKGTIRSNLQWGKPDATEDEMWQAIDTAQAREVVEGKRDGLDAEIAQNGKNLSGGQRQRLTIARALVRKPQILILDDSASALDYATDARLRTALKKVEGGTTTFIVSQRASSIRHADKIIVLDDGEMAGIGTHDQLLDNCDVYREIYFSQYPEERLKAAKAAGSSAGQQMNGTRLSGRPGDGADAEKGDA